MNRKGELNGVGILIVTAISIIVGAILLQASVGQLSTFTQTNSLNNNTIALPAAASTVNLNGKAVSNLLVTNVTSGAAVPASNYTEQDYVLVNGALVARILSNGGPYAGQNVNVSYTYEPQGYATDSGSRAIAGLIIVFGAIALAVIAMVPALRSGVIDMLD